MCEILIKAIDAKHSDPAKNERGCYKRGDIVVVMPDGHQWGSEEGLPRFVRVKIPGLDPETVKHIIEPHQDTTDPDPKNWVMLARRKWRVLVDDVPQGIIDQLRDNGEVTVTVNQIRNFVKNKIDGTTL